jgi:RNA polymerase sigma factor (sigma-70 family)
MPMTTSTTSYATPSVADLLLRIGEGDQAAWEEIVRRYSKLVSTMVRSFRLQDADALDAVQMTWLRLAENAHQVQLPERLGGWLATTARRECLHILRQTKPVPEHIDVVPETVADPSAGPSNASSMPTPRRRCGSSSASCRLAGGHCCGRCSPIAPGPTPRSPASPESSPARSGPPGRGPCGSCETRSNNTSWDWEPGDDDRHGSQC